MPYFIVLLAFAVVGMAIALTRAYGKLSSADGARDVALRDAEQLRAALKISAESKTDEVMRLRTALMSLHKELERAMHDVIASQDPIARRARMSELAERTEIILGKR